MPKSSPRDIVYHSMNTMLHDAPGPYLCALSNEPGSGLLRSTLNFHMPMCSSVSKAQAPRDRQMKIYKIENRVKCLGAELPVMRTTPQSPFKAQGGSGRCNREVKPQTCSSPLHKSSEFLKVHTPLRRFSAVSASRMMRRLLQ